MIKYLLSTPPVNDKMFHMRILNTFLFGILDYKETHFLPLKILPFVPRDLGTSYGSGDVSTFYRSVSTSLFYPLFRSLCEVTNRGTLFFSSSNLVRYQFYR